MSTRNKEINVAFEDTLEGFNDALVLSRLCKKYRGQSASDMQRSNDVIWRPVPYIAQSNEDGLDQTGKEYDNVQLSVPARLSTIGSTSFYLDALELRDALHDKSLGQAAYQKLASDINVRVTNTCSNFGTIVVARTGAASGFDDVAEIDATMNELGVNMQGRKLALSSRDYNGMASNLAERQTMQGKPKNAYERAMVGMVSSFDTYKLDYADRLTAATTDAVTIGAPDQYYVPQSTITEAVTGDKVNVDNRYQTITVAGAANVKVGDAFTIPGVESVHHITKNSTGQLKTFRVTGVNSATSITISPPFVSGETAVAASKTDQDGALQYQNITATPADGAAIVFLNTASANVNPFWTAESVEILPGHLAVESGKGVEVRRGTTDQGIELVMFEEFDPIKAKTYFRFSTHYGVAAVNPEMMGIELFGQV